MNTFSAAKELLKTKLGEVKLVSNGHLSELQRSVSIFPTLIREDIEKNARLKEAKPGQG